VSPEDRHLSPAEVVRGLGVSVRALKLYERRGLLQPVKTSAGWRAYGPEQIGRLHEILALKSLGLSLAGIGELLAGRTSDLKGTLEAQAAALLAQRDRLDGALRLIDAARRKLARAEPLPVSDLLDLIRETTAMEDTPFEAAYTAQLEKRLTPEELERLRNGMQHSRLALYAELKTLAGGEEDPRSQTSFDFMRRWSHLHKLAIGGDEDLQSKASAAWNDTVAEPLSAEAAPLGRAELAYLKAVGAAVGAKWRKLFAEAEQMAQASADPASPEALALALRMRDLSAIYNGHRSKAWTDDHRQEWLRSRPAEDRGAAFLIQASACAARLLEAA
jgi:DNA-binding transcriptional MerR regulator